LETETIEEKITIAPQPGGQTRFLLSPAFELLGGGSAGGGKSWDLVIDALGLTLQDQNPGKVPSYRVPGYRAVLFRRKFTQISQLLDEAKIYYQYLGGTYTAQRKGDPGPCFEFATRDPLRPSKIFFCHLQTEEDKENHHGLQYQYIGFDELTQFTLTQYLYLFHRARSANGVMPRIRSTTNPVGSGLYWVKKRFISGVRPNTINWFVSAEDPRVNPQGTMVRPDTRGAIAREFVPLSLKENLVLAEHDPQYEARIMQMGERMSKALLAGDWDAFGGDFFKEFDHREIVAPFEVPKEWRLIGSLDPGYSSACSFGIQAVDPLGNFYRIATYYERERNPDQHGKAIRDFIDGCKWTAGRMPSMMVADPSAWAKKDRFSVMASDVAFADVMRAHGLHFAPGMNDRVTGWWNLRKLMPKNFFVFEGYNDDLLEEMTAVVADEKHPEDIEGGGNDPNIADHALDELRYAAAAAFDPSKARRTDGWEGRWFGRLKKNFKAGQQTWKPGMG
jgi:hypothetical protein